MCMHKREVLSAVLCAFTLCQKTQIFIIIMIIDAHYEMAHGQPIDCCVNRTKELVWAKQGWNSDGQAWDASLCVSCTGL